MLPNVVAVFVVGCDAGVDDVGKHVAVVDVYGGAAAVAADNVGTKLQLNTFFNPITRLSSNIVSTTATDAKVIDTGRNTQLLDLFGCSGGQKLN